MCASGERYKLKLDSVSLARSQPHQGGDVGSIVPRYVCHLTYCRPLVGSQNVSYQFESPVSCLVRTRTVPPPTTWHFLAPPLHSASAVYGVKNFQWTTTRLAINIVNGWVWQSFFYTSENVAERNFFVLTHGHFLLHYTACIRRINNWNVSREFCMEPESQ